MLSLGADNEINLSYALTFKEILGLINGFSIKNMTPIFDSNNNIVGFECFIHTNSNEQPIRMTSGARLDKNGRVVSDNLWKSDKYKKGIEGQNE